MTAISSNNIRDIFVLDTITGVLYWKDAGRRTNLGDCAGWISYNNGKPYLKLTYENKKYYVHRLIWLYLHGEWPTEIDHIDGNTLNNAVSNLRGATRSQNLANYERKAHGTHRHGRKYRAVIWLNQVKHNLGSFDTKEEAEAAYKKAHIEFYGERSFYWRIVNG